MTLHCVYCIVLNVLCCFVLKCDEGLVLCLLYCVALTYFSSAIRYTLDGKQHLVNIRGFGDSEMVHFLDPEEYLYGTDSFDGGFEQGGVYNRGFVYILNTFNL